MICLCPSNASSSSACRRCRWRRALRRNASPWTRFSSRPVPRRRSAVQPPRTSSRRRRRAFALRLHEQILLRHRRLLLLLMLLFAFADFVVQRGFLRLRLSAGRGGRDGSLLRLTVTVNDNRSFDLRRLLSALHRCFQRLRIDSIQRQLRHFTSQRSIRRALHCFARRLRHDVCLRGARRGLLGDSL